MIFVAATHGTDQIRYIGTKDIELLVAARRETLEAEYTASMRNRSAPKLS